MSFRAVASCFGLTVNTAKIKFKPIGCGVCPADLVSLNSPPGTVECVESFRHLGCQVTPDGRSTLDVPRRVAAASGVFCALRNVVFTCCSADFTLNTKRRAYGVTVLAVLLYGSECWILRQRDLQCLETFHHQYLRSSLGVDRKCQIEDHISSLQVWKRWGDLEMIVDKIQVRRLQWLGMSHVCETGFFASCCSAQCHLPVCHIAQESVGNALSRQDQPKNHWNKPGSMDGHRKRERGMKRSLQRGYEANYASSR